MIRRSVFCFLLMSVVGFFGFGQASIIRDYVGMISQEFHPDTVAFLEKLRNEHNRRGNAQLVRAVDVYLKGDSGSGFVYVAGGKNYIITNFHVISQAETLSVTFEKPDGERTRYTGLTIVAADEDMDIALLAFAEGQRPFSQGLSFLTRAVQEGENVLSAGFPRLGTAMIWQLGAGIVSNALVRLPVDDETDKTIGPYIQHTAQVDPGNSGGPLLIQTPGVPSGYSVVGINTLSAIRRQGTNFSIPMNRVRSFLDASLRPAAGEDLTRLDTRLDAFIEGLGLPKAVYPHIAGYLSNACTGENVEYAYREFLSKGTRPQWENITNRDTVEAMSYFVAWLIENNLRSRGTISITKESVTPMDNGRYKVTFNVNNKPMDSEWVNEYGIWRIRTFGGFAAGDKTFVEKKTKEDANTEKLRTDPSFQFAAGYTQIVERGRALGLEFLGRSGYVGYGFSFYYSGELFQIDTVTGVYFPIKAGPVAFTPFLDLGLALQFKPKSGGNEFNLPIDFGLCFKPGLQFTTAAVPGLYLQFAYQYNLLLNTLVDALAGDTVSGGYPDEHFFSVSIGYSFSF